MEYTKIVAKLWLLVKENGEVVVVDGGAVLVMRSLQRWNIGVVGSEVGHQQDGDAFLDGERRLCVSLEQRKNKVIQLIAVFLAPFYLSSR